MIGLALSVLGSKVLFGVPLRGSLLVLVVVSMLYLLVALGIGLLISSVTKSQFVASQITLVVTFLPAMMLSGFMFDLAQHAVGDPDHHLYLPGTLLRERPADAVSRRRHLERDPAQRCRPGRHGDVRS